MKLWLERGAWASARGREKAAALQPLEVRRIAVIRHAALGDMVLTRPFLIELRRLFPRAFVTLSLVDHYEYGAPTDLVDAVHVVHGKVAKGSPHPPGMRERLTRARELGEQDVVFDLAGTNRSFWLTRLTPARLKVGFPYRMTDRVAFFDVAVLRSDYTFEGEVIMDQLRLLGACPRWPLQYETDAAPLERNRTIFYFPSASTPIKCWPRERFVELVRRTATAWPEHDHRVLAGTGEHEGVDDILAQLADAPRVEAAQRYSLKELQRALKPAALLVSNDTGVRNMALAAGTPTVGIFFATQPYRYSPREPMHRSVFRSDGGLPSVDDVFAAVREQLGGDTEPATDHHQAQPGGGL